MGINTPSYGLCGIALLPSLFIMYSVATNKHLFSCMLSSKEIKWKVLCTLFYLWHRHVAHLLFCALSRMYFVNSMLYDLDCIRRIHPRELILTSCNSCIMLIMLNQLQPKLASDASKISSFIEDTIIMLKAFKSDIA